MSQQEASLENKQSSGETKTKHGIPIDYGFAKAADEEAIQRTAVSLRERGFTVDVVSSSEEARSLVRTMLPDDKNNIHRYERNCEIVGIGRGHQRS